jgi:hypothetical protein
MKPIIINTYDYSPANGGVKVMHKLCHLLNSNGFESYLMPIFFQNEFYTCSDYNTPLVTNEILNNLDDCILLYPEGIKYNPLGAKNVVRWILGPSHQHDAETYSKSDLIYYINDYYYNDYLGQRENSLYVVEFHSDLFKNMNYKREGSCYTIRKANPKHFIHPKDSYFLSYDAVGDLIGLANLFNKCERFYCYDNHTFLFTQSAMCGCLSIVVPDPMFTKEQWMYGSRLHKYGVAYGEDDIPRAIETLPLLLQEIEKVKLEMNENVIRFAEHCQNYFK